VKQFDESAREIVLEEVCLLLRQFYFGERLARGSLDRVLFLPDLVGTNPRAGLRSVRFLDIQRKGNSQKALLRLLEDRVKQRFGLTLAACGTTPAHYVYLDDCLYTGNTLYHDLKEWLPNAAPNTTLHVVLFGLHTQARDYQTGRLKSLLQPKKVSLKFWTTHTFHNKPEQAARYDCLWPRWMPADEGVSRYAQRVAARATEKGWKPRLLRPNGVPNVEHPFSTPAARDVVEEQFFKAGVKIIGFTASPKPEMRPFGYEVLESFGFGALFVSYRNISNNCPLALWYGDPQARSGPLSKWYPLFLRQANEAAGSRPPAVGVPSFEVDGPADDEIPF
jgi:hypothetical protein